MTEGCRFDVDMTSRRAVSSVRLKCAYAEGHPDGYYVAASWPPEGKSKMYERGAPARRRRA